MTKARRIGNVLLGLAMILFALITASSWGDAYKVIVLLLGLSLILRATRQLIYYAGMARHMVDGRRILYQAVIVMDLGLFTISLTNVPVVFLVMYLAAVHGFSGGIDILRALESKREQSPSWRMNLSVGIINVIMAVLCLIFIKHIEVAVLIYSAGLFYAGVMRIVQAFRRTAVVYVL